MWSFVGKCRCARLECVIEVTDREALTGTAVHRGVNRRGAFRIDVSCSATAIAERVVRGMDAWELDGASSSRTLETVTEDLSMTGVRLRLPAPLAAGTRLALRINVDGMDADVSAEVMHSRADEFGAHAGLQFLIIDPQTRAHVTRFIASEERKRLPNVRVMYPATCTIRRDGSTLEGSTQECTPGFVRVLLPQPVAPTTATRVEVATSGTKLALDGHVVGTNRVGALWSTGVDLRSTEKTAREQWTDLLKHLRKTAS